MTFLKEFFKTHFLLMPWYYLTDSRQVVGPISEKALKELNAVGVLAGETQVCREGTDVWTSLNGIFGASSPEATKEADPDEVSGEDPKEFYDQGDSIAHSDESQEGAQKHSFSDRLKREAKAGWSDIKRTSREASVHAHIEKLKHVDLRMALFALGKKCYESGMLEGELKGQFQVIRELDTTIAGKRETSEAEAAETKMAALKRMGKDTAKASHAQALTVKRQHLVTELGRQAYAKMTEECRPGLEAEIADIEKVEGNIRSKEEEARTIGAGHAKGWKRITPRIAVAAALAVLLLGGGFFGLRMMGFGKEEDRKEKQIIPFGGSTGKSEGYMDNGERHETANRKAVRQFQDLLKVAGHAHPSYDGPGAAANILAAIENTNWNNCGPDLKAAAIRLRDAGDGGDISMGEFKALLVPFLKLCENYE